MKLAYQAFALCVTASATIGSAQTSPPEPAPAPAPSSVPTPATTPAVATTIPFSEQFPDSVRAFEAYQAAVRGNTPASSNPLDALITRHGLFNAYHDLLLEYSIDFGRTDATLAMARHALVAEYPALQQELLDPLRQALFTELPRAGYIIEPYTDGPMVARIIGVEPGSPASLTVEGRSIIRNLERGYQTIVGTGLLEMGTHGQFVAEPFQLGPHTFERPQVIVPAETLFGDDAARSFIMHEELHTASYADIERGTSRLNWGWIDSSIAHKYTGSLYGAEGFSPDELRAFRFTMRGFPENSLLLYELSAATLEAQVRMYAEAMQGQLQYGEVPGRPGVEIRSSHARFQLADVSVQMLEANPDLARSYLAASMAETYRYLEASARTATGLPQYADDFRALDARVTEIMRPAMQLPIMDDVFGPRLPVPADIPPTLQASSGVMQTIEAERGQQSLVSRVGELKEAFHRYQQLTGVAMSTDQLRDAPMTPEERATVQRIAGGIGQVRSEQLTTAEAQTLPEAGRMRQFSTALNAAGMTAGGAGVLLVGLGAVDAAKSGHLGSYLLNMVAGAFVVQGAVYVVMLTAPPLAATLIITGALIGGTVAAFRHMYNDDSSTLSQLLRGTTNVGPTGQALYEEASRSSVRLARPVVTITYFDEDQNAIASSSHGLGVWDKDTGELLCRTGTDCIYLEKVDPAPAAASDQELSSVYQQQTDGSIAVQTPIGNRYSEMNFSATALPPPAAGTELVMLGDQARPMVFGIEASDGLSMDSFWDASILPYATQYKFVSGPDGLPFDRGGNVSPQFYDAFFPPTLPWDPSALVPRSEAEASTLFAGASYLDTVHFGACVDQVFSLDCLGSLRWLSASEALFELDAIFSLRSLMAMDVVLPTDPDPWFPDFSFDVGGGVTDPAVPTDPTDPTMPFTPIDPIDPFGPVTPLDPWFDPLPPGE